ncbi:MAG: hypothetical protein LBN38_05695 [Verrucomicrobiota bacterium]|jgi:L-fucose isomerase-like protein|nr:hypothetical protein [Verrucomicrobiota bacterium]
MSFTYLSIASPLHDPKALSAALADYEQALKALGGRPQSALEPEPEGCPFYFIQTGGVENDVIRRYRSHVQQGTAGPVLLVAHPGHNALSAALEILAQVKQEGGMGRIYLLRGQEDEAVLADMAQTIRCLEANQKLSQDRIGRIGASSDWLVASSQRSDVVTRRFGARMLELPLEELQAHIARHVRPEDGPEFAIWQKATAHGAVSRETFAHAVGIARALREVARFHRLSALTLRCFDLLRQEQNTGCLALSLLSDEGLTAGCEGDIPSIVLLRWLWHLTGRTAWMANPADMDARRGDILLAHCTVPLGMLERYGLQTHFESGLGVGLSGQFPMGPVTLLRIGGAEMDQWWGVEGSLVENGHDARRCRTQARIQVPAPAVCELLDAPLGNHLVMAPGHVKRLFREAFHLLDGPKGRCGDGEGGVGCLP